MPTHHIQVKQISKQSFYYSRLNALTKAIFAITILSSGVAYASDHNGETYSSVTFFGDSLTDGGYFKPLTQAQGLAQSGQFTTNPDSTWATPLAEQLGLSTTANTVDGSQQGNNYAIGGARAGVDVKREGMQIAAVSSQVDSYLSNKQVDKNGLYSVWIGANDLLAVVGDLANADSIIASAVGSQVATINKLQRQGANYILVPNIPDVGLTPYLAGAGDSLQALGTGLSSQYNKALYSGVKETGANIIPLDSFRLLQQVAANPSDYGFSHISEKACGNVDSLQCGPADLVEPNANNTYFFADSIHPTGRAHRMIADYAHAVVTAPSQVGVLPHIATQSGLATNQRLQTHINQIQNRSDHNHNQENNSRNRKRSEPTVWASADVNALDIAQFESSGNTQLLIGMDFTDSDSDNAVTGIYGNITQTEMDSGIRTGLSQVDYDELGIGLYHSNQFGGVQLNAAVGYGNIDMDVTRRVSLDSYQQDFNSTVDGKRYYASLQAGYPLQIPKSKMKNDTLSQATESSITESSKTQFSNTTVTPYIGATLNRVKLGGIMEKELDSPIAMQFDKQKYNTTYGTIGIKASSSLNTNLNVFADLYYQKQLDDNRKPVTARINTLTDIDFNTPIIDIDDDSFGMTLGLSRQFGTINANAGVSHSSGEDEATSVFIGLSRSF